MNKGRTVFRLQEDGYPVFNTDGLAELREVWGSEEVMEYERPLLSLNTKGIEQKVTLPSGHVVIASLENNAAVDKRSIKRYWDWIQIITRWASSATTANLVCKVC